MTEDDNVMVNFFWNIAGGDVGNFLMKWPFGVPLPRKGEDVILPEDEYLHRVDSVTYNIAPSKTSGLLIDSQVTIIDIGTHRTFLRKNGEHHTP